MNKNILNTGVQDFIRNNLHADILSVALKKSPFPEITAPELAKQIGSKKKCEKKLPAWFQTPGIYYPDTLAVEQASSELTAHYKSKLVEGKSLADLTGGMGVDSYFFSKRIDRVSYCELNPSLAEISRHNFHVLKADNIDAYAQDGMAFLMQSEEVFDWVYLDPARRDAQKQRVFRLEDGIPNVIEHQPLLFSKSKRVLLKTAPMLDIQQGLQKLKQVSEIHVVAVRNEVKELLWILDKTFVGEPKIITINLKKDEEEVFAFKISEEKTAKSSYSPPLQFLYEPNAAILKAGAFKLIGINHELPKLHKNSHLYTSDKLIQFPGRRFRITAVHPYSKKFTFQKANMATRNFPMNPEVLRKKHRITAGGDTYLFFTTNSEEQLVVISCIKA